MTEQTLQHITPTATLCGSIALPASKSISNRALIINALLCNKCQISHLADCDDTHAMQQALASINSKIDIGAAGTAMRFLTAYLATREGQTYELTGSERMLHRPIGPLVEALRELGAQIDYLGNEGFPPLQISGTKLHGGNLIPHFGQSSQYFTALMLVAPYLEGGLTIHLDNGLTSSSYIQMTAEMMRQFGAQVQLLPDRIIVSEGNYKAQAFNIESDWSAASYWYELLAIAERGTLVLSGLQAHSWQGDAQTAQLFSLFGVQTTYTPTGISINYQATQPLTRFDYDFSNMPDMAQTFVVLCCAKGIPFSFVGLKTLKIKETDRIAALMTELRKCGYLLTEQPEGLAWDGTRCTPNSDISIATYKDHRMAMAFAPLAALQTIHIQNPEVVSKSYPQFWNQWLKVNGNQC